MPKLIEYPEAQSFDENDILIKDGVNGTKKIKASNAADYMGKNVIMVNEDPTPGTKVVLETTDEEYELALMSDVNSVAEEVTDLKTQLNNGKTTTPGYILTATNDGTGNTWSPVGTPTDAQVDSAVSDWLDEHPEATTTVEDGSITEAKLASDLSNKASTIITNYNEFLNAINDGNTYGSYTCKNITIDNTIILSQRYTAMHKSFTDGVFTLNADMFTWASPSSYYGSPNFVNCTFIGNGHSLFVDTSYVMAGMFVNCKFIDCSIVTNGNFVQSFRFINCVIENGVDNPFLQAKQIYDARFISCQVENGNKGIIVDATATAENVITTSQLSFDQCVIEGQTNYIVRMRDGDIGIKNCYTESNSMPFVKALSSNRSILGILNVRIEGTKINHATNTYFVEIDSSYENSVWASFSCKNSTVSQCSLVNTNEISSFITENINISSSGKILPGRELSKIYQFKNSIANFTSTTKCVVKKFPCLLTFDSNDGGKWHTNLYIVYKSYNNSVGAVCLSDPSKTISATYNSENDTVEVTLHAARGVYGNSSAVLLDGIVNDLIREDYWRADYSGYDV